ncbi:MAG: hypothetical protein ACOYJY_05610 [Acutalibacteraceae bacterium]|jgi:hypothetical protein
MADFEQNGITPQPPEPPEPLAGQTMLDDFSAGEPVAPTWEDRPVELTPPSDPWLMPMAPPIPPASAPVSPPGRPAPAAYAATPAGRMPTVAAPYTDRPLPLYAPEEPPVEDVPRMLTAASPLTWGDLSEADEATRIRWWPAVAAAAALLALLSLYAVETAAQSSIYLGLSVQLQCLLGLVLFAVAAPVTLGALKRRRIARRTAAAAVQAPGVIEVYADRVVHIAPRTRTVVPLRREDTVIRETARTLTVQNEHGRVIWRADDLTPQAVENLRRLLYPAFREDRRQSERRMMAAAETLAPLPDIAFTPDTLTRIRFSPDPRERRETAFRRAVALSLPFTGAVALVIGGALGVLFPVLPAWLNPPVFAAVLWLLLTGAAATAVRPLIRQTAPDTVGVALTASGAAIESDGNLRFIPRGWIRSSADADGVTLRLPDETLMIPWGAIPDPDSVKIWLGNLS